VPATVHDLRSLTTLPGSIYLDTSVLCGAYKAGAGSQDQRDHAAAKFLSALVTGGHNAWTSLLAIEEACWQPLRRELRKGARKHKRDLSLRDFRTKFPSDYAKAYRAGRGKTDPVMAFLKGLSIEVRGPRVPRPYGRRADGAICFLVRRLLGRYELEMADLFHIAIAKLDGTDAIASLDKGFRDVDGIEVYTVP